MNNQLSIFTATKVMTSREIAELTGKRHDNVMRDIDTLVKSISQELGNGFKSTSYADPTGRTYRMFKLDRDSTYCLVAGYDAMARMKVIKRLGEYGDNFASIVQEAFAHLDVLDLPADRFVYVAREGKSGNYKVGISKDPIRRVKQLNVGNPNELELVMVYKATEDGFLSETKAHLALEQYHIRGEWYSNVYPLTASGQEIIKHISKGI